MHSEKNDYDVIIIGGGPSGLSALLWCRELGLDAALFEKKSEYGGQLLQIYNPVTNYLGLKAKNGKEVRDVFINQLEYRSINGRLNEEVLKIDVKAKIVETKNGEKFSARALIIATGVRRRKLGIEGETEFAGKGILKSGSLEKKSVAGKKVLIIGGGDAALENARILSEYAERVYVAHRRGEFTARTEFTDAARAANNVEFIFNANAKKISGSKQIESVELENIESNSRQILDVDAVLIRIGVEPNSDLLSEPGTIATGFQHEKLALDPNGYILIDSYCETSVKGIYAIGDVANPISPTISTAAGGGATAAKAISALLNL